MSRDRERERGARNLCYALRKETTTTSEKWNTLTFLMHSNGGSPLSACHERTPKNAGCGMYVLETPYHSHRPFSLKIG